METIEKRTALAGVGDTPSVFKQELGTHVALGLENCVKST